MLRLLALLVLATMAAIACPAVAQVSQWAVPAAPRDVGLEWGVKVPLRDGLNATVSIYHPAGQDGPAPAILMLTPYMADQFHATAKYFAQQGFVVVLADTRGRGHSDGEWKPFVQDGPIGYDLVEWIARQPWSNGRVAMSGISYLGFTQWTTLKEFPPHLTTIIPTAAAYFSYTSLKPYNILSTYSIRWLTGVSGRALNAQLVSDTDYWSKVIWAWYAGHRAFADLPEIAGNRTTELPTWIQHPALDSYVEDTAVKPQDYGRIRMPILTVSGHFDSEQRAALRYYRRHMQLGEPQAVAQHYLIIGPWDHPATFWPRADIGGLHFASPSVLDMGAIHTEWYRWAMGGGVFPAFLKNRVAYYLMGAEEWRYADTLDGITASRLCLNLGSPGANPGRLSDAGTLTAAAPRKDPPDTWTYDPLDTRPGALELKNGDLNLQTEQALSTPADALQLFDAGVVYETDSLTAPLDLAGQARLRLWLAVDTPDTDFSASLYEITPDGKAIFLTQQLQRARFREGLNHERLLTPGKATPFVLDDFDFFARRIAAGSRIRLVVRALNSIRYEKNYNAGGVVAQESGKDARTAHVRLYHDTAHPSALELPIAAASRLASAPPPPITR